MSKHYTKPQSAELDVSHSTIVIADIVAKTLAKAFQGKQTEVHKVTSVARHGKRFDTVADVKADVTGTGAIRVIAHSVKNVRRESGYTVGNVHFAAFVMVNNQYGDNRDQRGELIASRLGVEVLKPSFSQAINSLAHKPVSQSQWDNITTAPFDDAGLSMFAVEWSQECRLNVPVDASKLDDFKTAFFSGSIAEGAPKIEGDIELPIGADSTVSNEATSQPEDSTDE
ncbi:hypothetical protein [Vibrio sp. LaRot3]|uniref:hypothetical protein n=1 Tax=Vibrio sp. LaRot3 TaxID=2998829 RepID=UPI0022CE2BD9|nr:hypothetical protein [Vibrio sp. LaRot3]MDA0148853.1 hypothetical protein [Vibrio sp. LaRot3]